MPSIIIITREQNMDIRITKSEVHTTASKELNIQEDLLMQDQNLQETLKAYDKKGKNSEEEREDI